jgi:hypothetical protein
MNRLFPALILSCLFTLSSLSGQDRILNSALFTGALEPGVPAAATALKPADIRFVLNFTQQAYRAQKQRIADSRPATQYLVVVTTDGMRWQEVFGGADSVLLNDKLFTKDRPALAGKYWADSPEERRQRLMPFLWSQFAQNGQLYGNRHHGNKVTVSNKLWYSYPGYNEIWTGKSDDARIFLNAKIRNPNRNVLEHINQQHGFQDQVAAFCSWDAFPYILHEKRSGLKIFAGNDNCPDDHPEPNRAKDFYTYEAARAFAEEHHPRVLYISLNATDKAGHHGSYQEYLDAANRLDTWLADIWNFIQNDPVYAGRTSLVVTTDHGRGRGGNWKFHKPWIPGANAIWFAVMGPDTPPTGEVREPMQIWQKQFAQTFARLVGEEFECGHKVAPSIDPVFRKPGAKCTDERLGASPFPGR